MVQKLSSGAYGLSFGGNATVRKSALSPLARSSFDQQLDCLRLARMGVPQCRDLWIAFERECEPESRLVAEAAGIIAAENRSAEKQVTKIISKAKWPKPPKPVVKSQQAWQPPRRPVWQPPDPLSRRQMWTDAELIESAVRTDFLNTSDPALRATAERALSHDALAAYWSNAVHCDPIRARAARDLGLTAADLVP